MRVGIGYDIHRLVKGRPMVIGSVRIPFPKGPQGHSDGDALLHAVTDALLGAAGAGDIGEMFPDTDKKYKGAKSEIFLKGAKKVLDKKGFKIGNIDCVVIAEHPKIGPYRSKIENGIGGILGLNPGYVSVKAKTSEGLGAIGEGKAIAAYAVVTIKAGHGM